MFDSLVHRVIAGESSARPPFWFMRQAGRYLPEYRQLRAGVSDFLSLCYTPELAAEVTLQPIRRFGMDAAIVFSDILVIPDAMGQKVTFTPGIGPRLEPVKTKEAVDALREGEAGASKLHCVGETLKKVRAQLPPETALIGFCGAPWTVASYMVEGGGSRDFETVRRFALEQEDVFAALIRKIVSSSLAYLSMQIDAGADVIQIFDSWAGILPPHAFRKWVLAPTAELVSQLKARYPNVPVIGFPRGAGTMLGAYVAMTGVDAVSVDHFTPPAFARAQVTGTLQGNLDPILLAADKAQALAETDAILKAWKGTPFIFNLGHGILPWTPIDHVEAVFARIREEA